MAVTIPTQNLKVYDPAGVLHAPEGASQTFKQGQLVKFSSGKLVAADADDAGLMIAAQDATGTTDTMLAYYKLTSSTEIEISVATTGAAAVGTAYGFTLVSSTTIPLLDVSETIATRFRVVRINLLPAGTFGVVGTDTTARVVVTPFGGATAWIGIA